MEESNMAPSTHAEASPASEIRNAKHEATIVLEPRKVSEAPAKASIPASSREEGSFQSSMLEYNRMTSGSKLAKLMIAITVHCVVIATPILAGLYFTDTLNLKQFATTFLVAPPPPPPPPPAAAPLLKAAPVHRVFENAGKLVAPTAIPKQIADIKEAPLRDEDFAGVAGGVPGGVAGGSMDGVIGGVIGGVSTKIAPPPLVKESKPKAPVRVGGRVREPRVISRVNPEYPVLAKQTHLQGTVIIDAILDEQGNVAEMKIVSGPALLIQSALNAVRKWRYEPTYLNDQPVSVQLNVTVTFRLSE
jgi:protein TonB